MGKMCFGGFPFNVYQGLGQGWEGGSKARSLAFSEIGWVLQKLIKKRGSVAGGQVGEVGGKPTDR